MTDDPLALTLKDAAARYGFSVGTLRAEIARGRLTKRRIGKRLHVTPPWAAAGFLGMTVRTLEQVYSHHSPDYQGEAPDV
jgi:hypothetical protein